MPPSNEIKLKTEGDAKRFLRRERGPLVSAAFRALVREGCVDEAIDGGAYGPANLLRDYDKEVLKERERLSGKPRSLTRAQIIEGEVNSMPAVISFRRPQKPALGVPLMSPVAVTGLIRSRRLLVGDEGIQDWADAERRKQRAVAKRSRHATPKKLLLIWGESVVGRLRMGFVATGRPSKIAHAEVLRDLACLVEMVARRYALLPLEATHLVLSGKLPEQGRRLRRAERTLALARFIADSNDPSWPDMMRRWNEEYPRWKYPNSDTFRRHATRAYRRVVGVEPVWEPPERSRGEPLPDEDLDYVRSFGLRSWTEKKQGTRAGPLAARMAARMKQFESLSPKARKEENQRWKKENKREPPVIRAREGESREAAFVRHRAERGLGQAVVRVWLLPRLEESPDTVTGWHDRSTT